MDNSTRQAKRAPVTLKIKFKSETLAQFIERYAVDVSPGGIFIRTKDPLAVGTPMKFEFQLRDATPLITGEGTVVWTRENDPARPNAAPGMGVRFDRLGDGSQTVLDKILAEKNKQATGATSEAQPRLFGDAPTRVAPSPLVGQLIGESRPKLGDMAPPRTGFGEDRTDTTPLPRPMPFHSDAEEFPDETFEEATKVRSVEDLIAATAHGGGLGGGLAALPGLGGAKPAPRSTLQMSTPPVPVPVPSTPMAPPIGRTPPLIPPPTPAAHHATPPPPPGHGPRSPLAPLTDSAFGGATVVAPPPPAHGPRSPLADSAFGGATVVAPPPMPIAAAVLPLDLAADVLSADAVGAEIEAPEAPATEAAAAAEATAKPAGAELDLPSMPDEGAMAQATPAPRPTPPMPMAAVEPAADAATEAKPADAATEAKPADAATEAKPADAATEAKPADAAEAKPADAAEAKPADAAAEALPATPATPAAEPAAPIEAATPPREPTPLPAPKAVAAAAAATPAADAKPASPPARMRPTGVPIPPPELTDPNRRHFVDTSAAAQIETPPLFTPTIIVVTVLFLAALGGLVWYFFLRPADPDELPVSAPETTMAPARHGPVAGPSVSGLPSADESVARWSIG